jgi:hypothetical protein
VVGATEVRRLATGGTVLGRLEHASELLAGLMVDVRGFCGKATPSDDVTRVIVGYEG